MSGSNIQCQESSSSLTSFSANTTSAGGQVPTQSPRVLSIQSHVVSGYVGNKCAVFPLQILGFEVDFVNSVQFSNHTGYGKWKGQVLAEGDLDDLYEGLAENNLVNYSHLLTGYVGTESFLRKIKNVVQTIKDKNPACIYMCDPVLGDNGHFYVPQSLIPIYTKEVLPIADITTPNTFELELLSGMKVTSETEAIEAMGRLHALGVKIVVLTSLDSAGFDLNTYVSVGSNAAFIGGCSAICSARRVFRTTSRRLEGVFTGTGDLFAALFLGWIQKLGLDNIDRALSQALSTMQVVLQRTKEAAILLRSNNFNPSPTTTPNGRPWPQELQLVQSLDVIMKPPPDTHQVIEINI